MRQKFFLLINYFFCFAALSNENLHLFRIEKDNLEGNSFIEWCKEGFCSVNKKHKSKEKLEKKFDKTAQEIQSAKKSIIGMYEKNQSTESYVFHVCYGREKIEGLEHLLLECAGYNEQNSLWEHAFTQVVKVLGKENDISIACLVKLDDTYYKRFLSSIGFVKNIYLEVPYDMDDFVWFVRNKNQAYFD